MAKKTTITIKRFTPVELGNGKVVTAIRNEFKKIEYEATLDGDIIGYYERFVQAESALSKAYAIRAAAMPATTEAAVVAALEKFEEEYRDYEATARAAGLADDATEWLRHANAYMRAREQYEAGIRPESLGDRAYVMPSQRPGGESHLLRFDGDWTCSCKAGASAHWAKHLIIGIERAYEDMQRFDSDPSGDDCPDHGPHTDDDCPKCDAPVLLDLGTRIARARMALA